MKEFQIFGQESLFAILLIGIFHVYNLQETFILIDFLHGSYFSILQKVLSSFVKIENFEELSLIDVDNR